MKIGEYGTVWITKYALTRGILERHAERCSETMVNIGGFSGYFHKPDWYESEEEAKKHANETRLKKIASLKKQLAKFEKLTF